MGLIPRSWGSYMSRSLQTSALPGRPFNSGTSGCGLRSVWLARRQSDSYRCGSGTSGCRDGLHPDRVNENQGPETVVSFLMPLLDIRSAEVPSAGACIRKRVSPFEFTTCGCTTGVPCQGTGKPRAEIAVHPSFRKPDPHPGTLALSSEQRV